MQEDHNDIRLKDVILKLIFFKQLLLKYIVLIVTTSLFLVYLDLLILF